MSKEPNYNKSKDSSRTALVPLPSIELSVYSAIPKTDRQTVDCTNRAVQKSNNRNFLAINRTSVSTAAPKKPVVGNKTASNKHILPLKSKFLEKNIGENCNKNVNQKTKTAPQFLANKNKKSEVAVLMDEANENEIEEIEELKNRLRQQSAEINEIKEALRSLSLNKSRASGANELDKNDTGDNLSPCKERSENENPPGPQSNKKDAQIQTVDDEIVCSRCSAQIFSSSKQNRKKSIFGDEDKENWEKYEPDERNGRFLKIGSSSKNSAINVRFDEKFSQFSPPGKNGNSEFSVFESKIATFYDEDPTQAGSGEKNEKRFFEKMIGIAQKWERAQGNDENGERYIKQQVSVLHRVSTKNPLNEYHLQQQRGPPHFSTRNNHWGTAVLEEDGQNPRPDRFAAGRRRSSHFSPEENEEDDFWSPSPPRQKSKSKLIGERTRRLDENRGRPAAVTCRDRRPSPENSFNTEVSVCTRDYFRRHGLIDSNGRHFYD